MKCFSFVIHHLFQISGHDHKKTAFFVEYLGLFFLNLVANGAAAVICEKYDEDSRRILSSQKDICVIETDVSAQTQARLASNFYDFSKEKLLFE